MLGDSPILIVGAGIVGLSLAQALRKEGIPFRIFDRDEHIDVRGHGWAVTLWAFDAVDACLPARLLARLAEAEVDPAAARRKLAKVRYMNLKTAKPVFEIEINQQRRINREKFRKLLLHGVDVEWGKSIAAINTDQEDGVTIEFSDGSSASGMMVVGADGANSKTRRLLCPHTGGLVQLPIRFMGVTVKLSPEQIAPLRAVDPMLFQGTYPDTGSFVWYSLLDTPEVNGSGGTASPYYACQLNLSWLVHGPDDEVPPESIDRVAMLKRLAGPFAEPFRSAFLNIDDGEQVTEIKLSDWSLMEWPNHDGRVTLMGDAAHAMVMYRGEAANHGITDAQLFKDQMVRLWKSASTDAPLHVARVVGEYEVGMKKRAQWSVFKSRGACFEAHDLAKIQPGADMFASNPSHEVEILRGVTAAVESGV